jgi:hypothetical protein
LEDWLNKHILPLWQKQNTLPKDLPEIKTSLLSKCIDCQTKSEDVDRCKNCTAPCCSKCLKKSPVKWCRYCTAHKPDTSVSKKKCIDCREEKAVDKCAHCEAFCCKDCLNPPLNWCRVCRTDKWSHLKSKEIKKRKCIDCRKETAEDKCTNCDADCCIVCLNAPWNLCRVCNQKPKIPKVPKIPGQNKRKAPCEMKVVDKSGMTHGVCTNDCVKEKNYEKCDQCHRWIKKKKKQCENKIGYGQQKYCTWH